MGKIMKETLHANGIDIGIYTQDFENEYISLTDIARYKSDDPTAVIQNWMRNRDVVDFLGLWEKLHNPDFNPLEFEGVRKQAGGRIMTLYEGRPVSAEGRTEKEMKVYDVLDSLGIRYQRTDHQAVGTIADCLEVDEILGIKICKNLFLCNRQRTAYYLLVMPGDKILQTKELSKQIPTSRLSFASGEDMEKYLNVTPGSATIMGLIYDEDNKVQLLVDEEVFGDEYFGCHPCVNTSSLRLRTEDVFGKYLEAVHHRFIRVELS